MSRVLNNASGRIGIDTPQFNLGKKLVRFEKNNPRLAEKSLIAKTRTRATKESTGFSPEVIESLEGYLSCKEGIPVKRDIDSPVTAFIDQEEFWSLLNECRSNNAKTQEYRDDYAGYVKPFMCLDVDKSLSGYLKVSNALDKTDVKIALKDIRKARLARLNQRKDKDDFIRSQISYAENAIKELDN